MTFHVTTDAPEPGGVMNVPLPKDAAHSSAHPTPTEPSGDAISQLARLELVRDTVALANSGGGEFVVSSRLGGRPPENLGRQAEDLRAMVAAAIAEYTGSSLPELSVQPADSMGRPAMLIRVGPVTLPIAFAKAGRWIASSEAPRPTEVFAAGSIYFRRDGQSVPGTQADLAASFERELRRVRRHWLRGIRHVLTSPLDIPRDRPTDRRPRGNDLSNLQPVRIVDDPSAPSLQPQDVDRLYPYRQKDLVDELNNRFGRKMLNSYDIQAVRRHHELDDRPDFVFHLMGAGRRYSAVAADWIAARYAGNPEFFREARAADQAALRLRRRKPR
jgi:hypothetical protein